MANEREILVRETTKRICVDYFVHKVLTQLSAISFLLLIYPSLSLFCGLNNARVFVPIETMMLKLLSQEIDDKGDFFFATRGSISFNCIYPHDYHLYRL
jgi:hypothetical protein